MELFEIGDNSLTHVDSLVVVQVFLLLFHLLSPLVRVVVAGNGPEGIEVPLDFEAQTRSAQHDGHRCRTWCEPGGMGQGAHTESAGFSVVPPGHDLSLEPHHIVHGPSLH